MNRWTAIAAFFSASSVVNAQPEVVMFSSVPSNGVEGSPLNSLRYSTLAGGYPLGRIDYSGTLVSSHTNTWRTDSRLRVTSPGGQQFLIQPFTSGQTFGSLPFSGYVYVPSITNAAGDWEFRFFESIDDGGPAVDATMTITLTFTDQPPLPPGATDLGVISAPGLMISGITVPAAGYRWYRFTLERTISTYRGMYLDIDTTGASLPAAGSPTPTLYQDDTEIALFDSSGLLVASDDDDGRGFTSQMSFGSGGRAPIGDGASFDGQDGALAPGVYYLAVGSYDLSYPAGYWNVAGSSGSRSGTITLAVRTGGDECPADFNGSGGTPDDADVDSFFELWSQGNAIADINNSGGTPDDADVAYFFERWSTGC